MSNEELLAAAESVVARADALMQRRRPQPVRPPPNNDLPVLTEAVLGPDDDLPVLTVIETGDIPEPSPSVAVLDPDMLDKLARELTRRLHDRIEAELPVLVEAALQTIITDLSRQLQQGMIETTEASIRDFISERSKKKRR